MRENYDDALRRVLIHEGGFSDHPSDPGGATMRGVTQRVYNAYRRRRGLDPADVRTITGDELREIYRTQYADKVRFDSLPLGLDYVVFDGAVNSGPAQSVKWLQRALRVAADGVVGNMTLRAVERFGSTPVAADALIDEVCDRRLAFCKSLKTWKTFGKGWTRRIEQTRSVAKAMNDHAPLPRVAFADAMNAKATVADANLPKAPTAAPTAGAGGGLAAGALQSVREEIAPYAGMWDVVDRILFGLTLVGAAIAVGGLAYGVYAYYRKRQIASHLDLDTDVQPDSEDVPYGEDDDPLDGLSELTLGASADRMEEPDPLAAPGGNLNATVR